MILFQGIAAAVAKLASASTIVQVATGVGITVAGVTGAGAAGVLPGPVQDGIAGAVESVTPFDLPDSSDERRTGADDVRTTTIPATATPGADVARHDEDDDVPGASPTDIPAVPAPPAAPSTSHETEHETEAEHHEVEDEVEVEDEDEDGGVHQHRGGRTETQVDNSGPGSATSGHGSTPTVQPAPVVDDSPEVEDDHGNDDGGHHGGGDDSDSDEDDDHSGHGGGDDD